MSTKTIELIVTEEDLKKAEDWAQNNTNPISCNCPIAQCLKRKYNKTISFGFDLVTLEDETYECPEASRIAHNSYPDQLKSGYTRELIGNKLPITLVFTLCED